jgi:uncharacterized protein
MPYFKKNPLFVLLLASFFTCGAEDQKKPDQKPAPDQQPIDNCAKEIDATLKSACGGYYIPMDVLDNVFSKAPQEVIDCVELWKMFDERLRAKDAKRSEFEALPKRLLLVGEPGTGKTTLANAISAQLKRKYVFVRAPLLGNEYKNSETANLTRILSYWISRDEPVVIIIDEINVYADKKENPLLQETNAGSVLWMLLDKCANNPNILVIGTANDVTKLPPQLKDRFEGLVVEIPKANASARKEILEFYLAKRGGHKCSNYFLSKFAKNLDGFSHRRIEALVNTAYQQRLLCSSTIKNLLEIAEIDPGIIDSKISEDDLEFAYEKFVKSAQLLQTTAVFDFKNWIKENSMYVQTLYSTINLGLLVTSVAYFAIHGKQALVRPS